MKKHFFIAITIFTSVAVHARTLHYGDASVPLTDTQKTFPALHIQMENDEIAYGAMYDVNTIPAPQNSVRIAYDDTDYWIVPWCAWRQYMPTGTQECADIPPELFNRFLTLEEANKYIIPTDIQQWELISNCTSQPCKESGIDHRNNPEKCACIMGTLQPGTYLFVEHYNTGGVFCNAQIAIFDHPVGYASMHAYGIFENLIDTEHETFVSYTLKTPYYTNNIQHTNITNLPLSGLAIAVYKLR